MTLTRKGTRVAAAATAKDISESNPESVASGEKQKEDDDNLESKERDKTIAEMIGRTFKLPSHNEYKEDEDKEEDVFAPLASIEDGSPGNKDDEVCEDYWKDNGIYDRKDTVLYNAGDRKEEASLGHKDES